MTSIQIVSTPSNKLFGYLSKARWDSWDGDRRVGREVIAAIVWGVPGSIVLQTKKHFAAIVGL